MPKYVVVHHAHHADTGIYRLTYAEAVDVPDFEAVPNPDHDPHWDPETATEPNPPPVMLQPVVRRMLVGHRDVVWDAGDPKWEGREPDDIAAEQRSILSEALTRQAAEAEQAEAEAQAAHVDLGGAGQEI